MQRKRKLQGTSQYLFGPANFDVRLVMGEEWVPYENDIRWMLHKIIRTRVCHHHDYDDDGYAKVSQRTMRTFMNANHQSEIKRILTERNVIEVKLDRNGNEDYLDSKLAKDGNGYSTSYRMTPQYDGEVVMWEITSKVLSKKMVRNRYTVHDKVLPTSDMIAVYGYLENWLRQLTILPDVDQVVARMPLPPVKRKKRRKPHPRKNGTRAKKARHNRRKTIRTLAAYHSKLMMAVQEIRLIGADESHRPLAEVCRHLRFHSSVCHLATICRAFLRVSGRELVNVDIRNSQIVFFIMLYIKSKLDTEKEEDAAPRPLSSNPKDDEEGIEQELDGLARIPKGIFTEEDIAFFRLVLNGELYDWLMEHMGVIATTDYEWENIRQRYKRTIFKDIFYGDPNKPYTNTALSRFFASSFPAIWSFIKNAKKGGYEKLAQQMQRQEAQFVLHTVCKRLKDHHPDVPVVTIHDSLMVPPEHATDVHRIMTEEFMRLGLKPTIRIGKG